MLFHFENVTKRYGKITALDGLSCRVPRGAIGLLGPNGAGKTTMIRTLLGLIPIDPGIGRGAGHGLSHAAARHPPGGRLRARGRVPVSAASRAWSSWPTPASCAGCRRSDALQRAHEVLDYVGLGEARYRPVESYSTGMKQRLKLASAIVHDPRLLILDEPTNGMDPAGRQEMLELARDLAHGKGMSLLFSSHLLPDVEVGLRPRGGAGQRPAAGRRGKIQELKQAARPLLRGPRQRQTLTSFARRLDGAGCTVGHA